jgi:hypothetical protein
MDPVTRDVMRPVLNPLFPGVETLFLIGPPFYVEAVDFNAELSRVDVRVAYHRRALFRCLCGREGLKVHSRIDRSWRALDVASYQCHIHLAVPRLKCPDCGVRTFQVPWARDHSHLTVYLEERIMALADWMPLSEVARFLRESDSRVRHVLEALGHHSMSGGAARRRQRAAAAHRPAKGHFPAEGTLTADAGDAQDAAAPLAGEASAPPFGAPGADSALPSGIDPASGAPRAAGAAGDAHDAAGEIPDISGDMPDVAGGMPDVAGSTPYMAGEMPDVADEMQDVAGDTQDVAGDTPDMAGDTPDVAGGMHYVAVDTSDVASDMPHGADDMDDGERGTEGS